TVASMLRLVEPWFCSSRTIIADSWFGSTDACITLYNHGLYSILQIKKRRYWPKNIPSDITDVLGDTYGSFVSRISKINNVNLTVCSIRDRKDIVLLASCSTTMLGTEVNRYIKGYGNATFRRPVVFDEYNEFKSAVDILNNL
ncbi:10823_t:CDS:1, partial [Funneliformis caledonium]